MASVRDYIQINPTEKRNKALGVIFPFDGEAVFNSSFTTAEQVKSNLLNVLLTEPGERVFKPNFGVGLRSYLFENSNDFALLEERINNQINKNIAGNVPEPMIFLDIRCLSLAVREPSGYAFPPLKTFIIFLASGIEAPPIY